MSATKLLKNHDQQQIIKRHLHCKQLQDIFTQSVTLMIGFRFSFEVYFRLENCKSVSPSNVILIAVLFQDNGKYICDEFADYGLSINLNEVKH